MLSAVVLIVVPATRILDSVIAKLATLVELAPTSMEKLLLLLTKLAVLSNVLFAHMRKLSAVVLLVELAIRALVSAFVKPLGPVVRAVIDLVTLVSLLSPQNQHPSQLQNQLQNQLPLNLKSLYLAT